MCVTGHVYLLIINVDYYICRVRDLTARFQQKYLKNLLPGRLILLTVSSIGCSVISIAGG